MIHLSLNIKPYSYNAYFYGNRNIKKREAREWELSMIELLKSEGVQNSLAELKNEFDPKKHCIKIGILCTYPRDIFFTQKGTISAKTFDVTNVEKPIVDVIFLEKYATKTIKNIGIDDKYITDMTSQKRPSIDYSINLQIELDSLESLEDIPQL